MNSRTSLLVICVALTYVACLMAEEPASRPTTAQTRIADDSGQSIVRYEADDSILPNPERGFYWPYNPPYDGKNGGQEKPHPPLKSNELRALRDRPEAITLIRDDILIPRRFWDNPLSKEFLDELQSNFDAVRQAGMKAAIRFLYEWSMNNRDPDEKTINAHLDQLQGLLDKNADVIAWVQAGLFGGCGEGNSSDQGYIYEKHPAPNGKTRWQGLSEAGRRIYLRELDLVPRDRMMSVRYPRLKWDLFGWLDDTALKHVLTADAAFDGSDPSRVGYYNEGFMGDENHYAMFQLTGEADFTTVDTLYSLHEGEISNASPYKLRKKQVVLDMARYHMTALNCGGDDWDKVAKAWKANGDYDEITRRMGYRFRLIQTTMQPRVRPGGTFTMTIEMANDGFARPVNPRCVEVILRNAPSGKNYCLSIDKGRGNRLWLPGPGETKTLSVTGGLPKDIPSGEYEVILNLPDPCPTLRDRPEYSIRLANRNLWDAARGSNNLQQSLTVDSAATGETYSGNAFFVPLNARAASRPASQPGAVIGVYESEANAAEYKGAYQSPLRQYLKEKGLAFQVIGDKQASDGEGLSRFAAVITSSCYIVPDKAAEGLAKYVAGGGRLVWMDGPARCTNSGLLAVLGIEGGFSYVQMKAADFTIAKKDHFVCTGIANSASPAAGNPAVKASGETLATWSGAVDGQVAYAKEAKRTFPAIVVTTTGKGQALLVNWIPWANPRSPEMQLLLANTIEWALAAQLLRDRPCHMRAEVRAEPFEARPLELAVRVLARPEFAGRTASLKAGIVDALGKARGEEVAVSLTLKQDSDGQPALIASNISLPTPSLPDGEYVATIEGSIGDAALPQARIPVAISAVAVGKRRDAEAQRPKLLHPLLAGTLGDYDAEPRTAKFRVDIPRLMAAIDAAHMNTYDFLIWHAKTDWDDLHDFVKEARKRDLKVWVTLCPPSEPPPSEPFGLDYIRWADEIGKLSEEYDNIVAVVIDDFWSTENRQLFTPPYIARLSATLYRRNPKLAFLATIYWETIGDPQFMKDYGPWIDGIVFPYADLESTKALPSQLDACRKWLGPDKLMMMNIYATGSSGPKERGTRTAEYMRSSLTISRDRCDGIRIYCLPKEDLTDYRFKIAAELFGKWKPKPPEKH